MSKIKVMHLVESLGIGGMENGVINLANRLDKKKFKMIICCTGNKGNMADRISNHEVELIALGNTSSGKQLGSVFTIKNILQKYNIDIMHTHGWGGRSFLGIIAAMLAKTPVCINGEHGYIFANKKSQVWMQNILSKIITGTLSVSEGLQTKLNDKLKIKGSSITVIPNGVDTSKFTGKYAVDTVKRTLGLCGSDFLIGVVGTLKQQKRQEVVCRAVEDLKTRGVFVKLLLVGDGPDRKLLEGLVCDLGIDEQVHFLGARDDMHIIYSLLDVLVVSSVSDHEGMSNVILEAMSSGVPVISTHSVGSNELIDDMNTGIFFNEDAVCELSEKILQLFQNAKFREGLKNNALHLIERKHTLGVMVNNYEKYYTESLLKNKGKI